MWVTIDDNKVVSIGTIDQVSDNLLPGRYELNITDKEDYLTKVTGKKAGKLYGKKNKEVLSILKAKLAQINSDNYIGDMGILLSGDKGTGKSYTINSFLNEAEKEYPVIFVTDNFDGTVDYISKNIHNSIVVFDEFEKIFPTMNKSKETNQNDFLLLLDSAMNNSNNMYIFLVNKLNNMSEYLLGRPGRIRYHFTFGGVNRDSMYEYLNDNLNDKSIVDEVIDALNYKYDFLTYDHLNAICSEHNSGIPLDSILRYINIEMSTPYFTMRGKFRITNPGDIDQYKSNGNKIAKQYTDDNGDEVIEVEVTKTVTPDSTNDIFVECGNDGRWASFNTFNQHNDDDSVFELRNPESLIMQSNIITMSVRLTRFNIKDLVH